jgi:hypothetical protein
MAVTFFGRLAIRLIDMDGNVRSRESMKGTFRNTLHPPWCHAKKY